MSAPASNGCHLDSQDQPDLGVGEVDSKILMTPDVACQPHRDVIPLLVTLKFHFAPFRGNQKSWPKFIHSTAQYLLPP